MKLLSWPLSYWLIGIFSLNLVLFLLFLFSKTFTPMLVIIHVFSLILIWGIVVSQETISWSKYRTDFYIAASLFLLAFLLRLWQVEVITPGMYSDEVTVAQTALKIASLEEMPPFSGLPYTTEGHRHPTPLLYATAWSIELFGKTLTAIRLPSLVFGALGVVAFYVLLRQFFPRSLAGIGGLLLVTSYSHLVLSRLAYEPAASLFFQILALLFAWLFYKSGKLHYLVGIALALGGGIYTYLNFRIFAVVLVILTITLIVKKVTKKHIPSHLFYFFMALFIAVTPLASYSLLQPGEFFTGRAQELSIFSYPFPPGELQKELSANIARALGVFIGMGDPNFGKNPANQGMFDLVTLVLFYTGVVVLSRKNRLLVVIATLLIIPPILSDSLSLERIPEFHYYGLGHPNMLRLSGLLVVVLFFAVWGIHKLYQYLYSYEKTMAHVGVGLVVSLVVLLNLLFYFNQQAIHPLGYEYNYLVNKGPVLAVIKKINASPEQVFYVSPGFYTAGHTKFFLDKKFIQYVPTSSQDLEADIQNQPVTVLEVSEETKPILQEIITKAEQQDLPIWIDILFSPYGDVDAVLFEPKN